MDARKWEMQRYIGHRYYLALPDAQRKFGNLKWKAASRVDYLDAQSLPSGGATNASTSTGSGNGNLPREAARTMNGSASSLSSDLSYVEIVELYDLVSDQRIVYSPNLESRDGVVEKGPIPIHDADGVCLPPIFCKLG